MCLKKRNKDKPMKKNFSSIQEFKSYLFKNGLMASVEYDSNLYQYQVSNAKSKFIQSAEEIWDSLPKNLTIRNKVINNQLEVVPMSEQVKVNLVVEKRERYQKTITMTKQEFEEYDLKLYRSGIEYRSALENLGERVDSNDWFDGQTEEIEEFNIIEGDENEG